MENYILLYCMYDILRVDIGTSQISGNCEQCTVLEIKTGT